MNTDTRTNTTKPLINVRHIRAHLLEVQERLQAHQDEQSAHVVEALTVILDASQGVKL